MLCLMLYNVTTIRLGFVVLSIRRRHFFGMTGLRVINFQNRSAIVFLCGVNRGRVLPDVFSKRTRPVLLEQSDFKIIIIRKICADRHVFLQVELAGEETKKFLP